MPAYVGGTADAFEVSGSSGDLAGRHRQLFGDSLYSAAERAVQDGRVLDVRVLQGGTVITGIVGADAAEARRAPKFRVYIRNPATRMHGEPDRKMHGECSCGERGICVHMAAVSIAATGTSASGTMEAQRGQTSGAVGHGTAQWRGEVISSRGATEQRLCYTIEKIVVQGHTEFQVSAWVAQMTRDARSIVPGSACVFVPRLSRTLTSSPAGSVPARSDFEWPRYVDAADRTLLGALTQQSAGGPWRLYGSVGAAVLEQIIATGRAFHGTLPQEAQSRGPLKRGAPRRVAFGWVMLANGDQKLSWEMPDTLDVLADIEPPAYMDSSSNESAPLELPFGIDLLRMFVRHPAVAPEQIAAVNLRIDETSRDGAFPRLREIEPAARALESLRPRLLLSADERIQLYFIYNGTPVDSSRLLEEQRTVRLVAEGSLYEIPRDLERENAFRSELAAALGTPPESAAAWLAFMMKGVPDLQVAGWDVGIDDRFPYRVVAAQEWYGDLGADASRSSWFNLRLGVLVEGQPVNLLGALTRYLRASLAGSDSGPGPAVADAAGCRVGEYWLIRLDDGRYLPIAMERIERIAHTLVELFERDSLTSEGALALPRAQGGRLAQLAIELNQPTLQCHDPALSGLIDGLRNFSGIRAITPPASFRGELRMYQQEGLGWLQFLREFRLGGILADDMGLGKTVQTIAHIVLEVTSGRLTRPVLIVSPVSALGNWHNELARFAPELSVHTWHGSQRRKGIGWLGSAQVILTAYPLLLIDSEILLEREYGLVILDEAQMIKNPGAKVSQMARALRAEGRLCLSGTPVENHLGELWSLFEFLQPGLLGDERHFQRHYRTPIEKNADKARAEALSARVAPFLLRRTKDAVAKELPPKVEIVESLTLDERQRDFYDGVRLALHQHIQEIIRQQGLARSQITILDALLKLRQACCDPRLVNIRKLTGAAAGQDTSAGAGPAASVRSGSSAGPLQPAMLNASADAEAIPSAKLEWLSTVLPELIAEGRRILLFSQFTSMLRLIEPVLTTLEIPYCLLTGETQDRTAVVSRFQSGEVPLFLISLKAGGTALNLTAADTVIHYDPWWNPAVEAQATDRAHRIGQTRSVFVYKLIAQGTVEERMLQLQADKRVLAERLYTDKSASPTALSASDLEMLFAP